MPPGQDKKPDFSWRWQLDGASSGHLRLLVLPSPLLSLYYSIISIAIIATIIVITSNIIAIIIIITVIITILIIIVTTILTLYPVCS